MVFPFENNTASGGRALGEALADAVQRGMEASKVYGTVKYSEDSVLVRQVALKTDYRKGEPSPLLPARSFRSSGTDG